MSASDRIGWIVAWAAMTGAFWLAGYGMVAFIRWSLPDAFGPIARWWLVCAAAFSLMAIVGPSPTPEEQHSPVEREGE